MEEPVVYERAATLNQIAWEISCGEADEITARGTTAEGSIWFDGHFPGNPILPGIAQLSMVVDILTFSLGRKIRVTRLSRVRFKSAIRPNDPITVEIRPKAGDARTFSFRVVCGAEPASGGTLTIAGPDGSN